MPKNEKINIEDIKKLRNSIDVQLTDITIEPSLKKEDAVTVARERGATDLTKNKLTYLVEQGLVKPKIIEGDRNTHLFGREHISNIILIQRLKKEKGLSYSRISSFLLSEQNGGTNTKWEFDTSNKDVGLPPQVLRAQYILYSRVIGVLLKHLLGDALKPGLIIFLRQRHAQSNTNLPKGTAKISQEWMDLKEADDYIGFIRPKNDLVAFVSPELEILFSQLDKKTLVEYKKMLWLSVTILIGSPVSQYVLLVGVDNKEMMDGVHISQDSFEANIVGTLLKILFTNPAEPKPDEDVVPENEFDKSTVLYSLVNFIPEISDLWEYCAVLTSSIEKPNHLRISALSRDFPKDMRQEVPNLLVKPGQPLTGWVYQTNYPMVIQRSSGALDPRLAYQNKENATAAIAIPTRARDRFNGVLYVGTRYQIPEETLAFTDAEIRVLQIIADIAGEVIERNRITNSFEVNSSSTIGTPLLRYHNWNILQERLTQTLQNIKNSTIPLLDNDNLHLTIVRIESHSDIYRKDLNISGWLASHILETTKAFFNRNEMGNPEIFLHNESLSMSRTKEFVCLIPILNIADERDRELRDKLRNLLSSIKLSFPFDQILKIETNVWSMPFRYKNLLTRMESKKINIVVEELLSEIEDALVIIPNIEKAHQKEKERAYAAALEQYLEAAILAPKNRYLQRHIAKAYAAIGDLKNSAKYWEKIISQEDYSNHYLRYAHVLARMGNNKRAKECYQKAHSLNSQNSKILIEWGDLLTIEGKYDDAIKKFEAALKLEANDRDHIWLRLAEVNLEMGNVDQALSLINLVLDRLPDHQDAHRLILKVLKKIER